MSYSLPVVRKRKRRRAIWVAAVGSVIVLLGLLAFRFIDDRTRLRTYLDAARDTASVYEGLAVRADALIAGLEAADRPALLGVLEETSVEAAAAERSLLDVHIPNDVGTAGGFLTTAVAAWRDGIGELEMGVGLLLEDPGDVNGGTALKASFLDFRVGDRAYEQFAVLIAEHAGERPFPDVAFVTAERDLRYDADLVVLRLAAVASLAADHDIAVADVRFDPEPTGDREGRAVIPFSATLNLEVSVVNRGNEPESDIPVRLRLVGRLGDIIYEDSQTIGSLLPGAAANLLFSDLPVQPGEFYELIIAADLDNDEDQESNVVSRSFYRNDSA
ncbi:MAG: hypothetical protein OES13_04090 [Acidimicrobiia bacterium]|nr:hypothetical protein [Acidimicrobiia bacterium]